ncbi:unnamed protein product [Dibothriocephalus latus]|uniref:Uncharacterized protein n=1 Tax=Dibothriocephalus latus TaxID=60516 RepID=A0A3P7NGZ2_DIBLA|nr:unnamed protein product [Dibothriocephalus latus]
MASDVETLVPSVLSLTLSHLVVAEATCTSKTTRAHTHTGIKASVTDGFSNKASTRKERKESKVDSSDTGRRRRRHRFRRRTVDEFLSSPGESINTEVEAGWIEADDTEAKESSTDPNLTITQGFPVPKTSFSIEHPDKSQSKELEEICEDEKRHTDQLMELVKASPVIMSSLSKSMSTDFLERTKAVNAAQIQLVSALEEACSQRNPGISKIVDRLCERQSQLITYANLTPNILSVLKSKKEQPKSAPRLKKTIPITSPEMVKLITAEEELFGTANNLNEFSSKLAVQKEPIKTSLVVEMKPTGPGERKLRTLFLFDDLLVSAHQRAIVFHKHFSQEDGEKSVDCSELLFDSETMSTLSEKSDPVSLQMRTRSISRYEVKWFLPLDQLDNLRTDGQGNV